MSTARFQILRCQGRTGAKKGCGFVLEARAISDFTAVHATAQWNEHPVLACPNCGGDMRADARR